MDVLDRFHLFVRRADELAARPLVRQGGRIEFTVQFEAMRSLRMGTREPDEEQLRSFLMALRPFVSPKEPIFLDRVYNLCHQRLRSETFRNYLVEARKAWKRSTQQGSLRFLVDDQRLSPADAADLWINGYYFHADLEKERRLKQLNPSGGVISRYQFLEYCLDAARQVLYVRNVLLRAIGDGLIDP